MTTATKTRTARPVYAIPTGTGHAGKSVRVGTATSITGAIEQVRASGFRVMAKGGDIGLQSQTALTGSDEDALVWGVTVYDN